MVGSYRGIGLLQSPRSNDQATLACFSRGCWLAAALMLLVLSNGGQCRAAERPTAQELRRGSEVLRAAVQNVQGEIRIYRSETAIPAALEKLPTDLEMPLILSGTLWRSAERFRADYKALQADHPITKKSQHSVAFDDGKVYVFSSARDPNVGGLQVYEPDSPNVVAVLLSNKHRFHLPIDALWSNAPEQSFVDLLATPGAKILPSQTHAGGLTLIASSEGTDAEFEFAAVENHPFSNGRLTTPVDDQEVELRRRVFFAETDGILFPTRVVEVMSFGPTSYTEVVMLDLKPLQDASPIAAPIGPESFQNLGLGYQVYTFGPLGEEGLAERYERGAPQIPVPATDTDVPLSWVIGAVVIVVALMAWMAHRRYRNKSKLAADAVTAS